MKTLKYKVDNEYQELYKVYTPKTDPFNGYDYVDMGEVGIWATCNVGADSPEKSGLFFAWGETEGYVDASGDKKFSNNDYKFGEIGNPTKYNSTDGLKTLEPEDDAAYVNMGGGWRMPTRDEFVKLNNLCNSEWTDDYNGTGVKGRIFKLKTDETKQIFFPAAGYCNFGSVDKVGSSGYVWCSSLTTGVSSGCYLYFRSDLVNPEYIGNPRSYGRSVRGFIPKSE